MSEFTGERSGNYISSLPASGPEMGYPPDNCKDGGSSQGSFVEVTEKGKCIRVPALAINGTTLIIRGKFLKVASVHEEWWLKEELADPEGCIKHLKERGSGRWRADLFTFMQKLPGSRPNYPYHLELDSVAATRTESFKAWWEKLPQETRKNVRRAEKRGVVVKVRGLDDDLIQGMKEVNDDSPLRQGGRNFHYGKSFDQTRKEHSSFLDRSDFICAYHGDELIGFLKLVYQREVAAVLNLATKPSHNDKRPSNALIAKAVELCESRGIPYLNYGMLNYGNKRRGPLREFKIRNGFEEMLTPRFYVPLTAWGGMCMKLGFHRGLLGILPSSVVELGVSGRLRWYSLKHSIRRCSSMAEQPNRIRQTERSNPPAGSKF